jgi:hypothetical protein
MGVPVEAVGAAFAFVRSGVVQRPEELPDALGIARLLAGQESEPADAPAG